MADPKLADRPVPEHTHNSLFHAWRVKPNHQMCLIFDVVNPVRKFKRDSVYNKNAEESFAKHNDPNLSETDAEPPHMPAYPVPVQCIPLVGTLLL